jgi:hypothetical protein
VTDVASEAVWRLSVVHGGHSQLVDDGRLGPVPPVRGRIQHIEPVEVDDGLKWAFIYVCAYLHTVRGLGKPIRSLYDPKLKMALHRTKFINDVLLPIVNEINVTIKQSFMQTTFGTTFKTLHITYAVYDITYVTMLKQHLLADFSTYTLGTHIFRLPIAELEAPIEILHGFMDKNGLTSSLHTYVCTYNENIIA